MRILIRNTVFKTVALRGGGLFLCVIVLASAFFGITASVHATHNQDFIHADEVGTDQERLKQFVQDAVDAYYIDFIFREHCNFPSDISSLFPFDPETAPVETIKPFIPQVSLIPSLAMSIGEICDYTQPFSAVFRSAEAQVGEWESDSIYLFVMNEEKTLLFHGSDPDRENEVLEAIDAGERDVAQLILNKVKENPKEGGFVDYCWDDPAIEDDNIGGSDPTIAPGDSWKRNYVVDPFELLGAPKPAGFPDVIFGSGIYPKTGNPPPGCDGNGMADYDEEGMGNMEDPMEDMQEPVEESMDEPGEGEMDPTPTSVSGGGCAIVTGSDSTPRNEALNLLLIVSALFLAVSFRRRVTSKRNSVQF